MRATGGGCLCIPSNVEKLGAAWDGNSHACACSVYTPGPVDEATRPCKGFPREPIKQASRCYKIKMTQGKESQHAQISGQL